MQEQRGNAVSSPRTGIKLIEHPDSVVGYNDDEYGSLRSDLDCKSEEGAARQFTLSKAYHGADFGSRDDTEVQSIRRYAIRAVHDPVKHLLPLVKLGPGVPLFETA